MPSKSNGEWIPGGIPVPSNYPDPASQNINAHPMDWAYGNGNATMDNTAPSAPTSLASPAKTATTVDLTWTASSDNIGVTGYDVFRDGTKVASVSGTSTTVTGLTTATQYAFTVKAKDATGNTSAASNSLSVTTS